MTTFVDASALVAIGRDEPETAVLLATLGKDRVRVTSAIALWETARAFAKSSRGSLDEAWAETERLAATLGIGLVTIGDAEATEAFRAHARYGKGRGHAAKLNLGDCFAYACAKTNDARLLYKGDDFARTDLA